MARKRFMPEQIISILREADTTGSHSNRYNNT
jgi:hypothetical protein